MAVNVDITIRLGRPDEADALSDLAYRSKAHWGYPSEWMDLWRAELTIDAQDVAEHRAFVAEVDGCVAGFYVLKPTVVDDVVELDFLFVDSALIGTGVGASLFRHAIQEATSIGFRAMIWGSDPNADGFYYRMGARKVGERKSPSVSGRSNAEMRIDFGA